MDASTYSVKFNSIRPFNADELPEVFERLLANEQFRSVMTYVFPDIPYEVFAEQLRACQTSLDVQKKFAYRFLENLVAKEAIWMFRLLTIHGVIPF